MDDTEAEELILRLCTVAGMLMEDALPIALVKPKGAEETMSNLASLRDAAADIATLIDAAELVVRRRSRV